MTPTLTATILFAFAEKGRGSGQRTLPSVVADLTEAVEESHPWTRGHALVIPRNHSRNLYDAPDEDLAQTVAAAKRLALRMRDALGCDGINLLNSCEAAAWQTVFHLHVHVIPRYEDDPLRLPGQPREPEEGELAEVAAKLRGG